MKKLYKLLNLTVLAAAMLMSAGCTDSPDTEGGDAAYGDFYIDHSYLNFNFERGQEVVFVPVKTQIPEDKWIVEVPADAASWCKVSRSFDNLRGLQVAVSESEETEIRSASVKVGAGSSQYTLKIKQLGYGPAILVSDLAVGAAGGDVELEIVANIDYTVAQPVVDQEDEQLWVERSTGEGTRAFAQQTFGYHVKENNLPFPRTAKIAITAVDPMYFSASTECSIMQNTKSVEVDSAAGLSDELTLKVFSDLSCTELRSGVTRADIIELYAAAPYLAQYVAVPMMNDSYLNDYERQFRMDTYKPYSNIDLNNKLLTKKYSRLDNPTGIEVKAGERILVMVDKIPDGQSVSLAVYGKLTNSDGTAYAPNYGGMSGSNNSDTVNQEVTLEAGCNAIDITADGMCYVMNTAEELSAASQSIKVHIAGGCGIVHGYFDLARHTDEDYMEILSHTGYEFFVAKGKNMIFNFHTSKLRELAPTGISSGLSAWDDIEGWQKELMGIDKLTWFNNHTMAVSTSESSAYMDASNRRVNFQTESALPKIISREALLAEEDNTWGPAHELGHVNQGAINWKSTTESSNNLFSNYAIYKMGKYKSRGQTIEYLANCFANGEPWALMGSSTHQNEDTEVHMRMNWQLWNYYHRCGVNPEFFPTLFGMLREDPLPSEFASYFGMSEDPGASQLKYAEKVCDAAKQDLTDFFEAWGFYRTIDVNYEQYGTARYRVTEDMIAESKARIAEKEYPKAPAIEYIEDRQVEGEKTYSHMGYYTTYQDKTAITKSPRYSVSGRTYTVSDCDQAVAVEIRRTAGSGLGELLYFSNLSTFTVPAAVDLNNTAVYAVQYDGERKQIANN